jgi:hypothetical protein
VHTVVWIQHLEHLLGVPPEGCGVPPPPATHTSNRESLRRPGDERLSNSGSTPGPPDIITCPVLKHNSSMDTSLILEPSTIIRLAALCELHSKSFRAQSLIRTWHQAAKKPNNGIREPVKCCQAHWVPGHTRCQLGEAAEAGIKHQMQPAKT